MNRFLIFIRTLKKYLIDRNLYLHLASFFLLHSLIGADRQYTSYGLLFCSSTFLVANVGLTLRFCPWRNEPAGYSFHCRIRCHAVMIGTNANMIWKMFHLELTGAAGVSRLAFPRS